MRLFVDLDGTLAEFRQGASPEELYKKGYFETLKPESNMVSAIRALAKNPEVYVLSAYLPDSKTALAEKKRWLDRYIPELSRKQRLFIPCGESKESVVPGGIRKDDVLVDDYNCNLRQWNGIGVKALNGINDRHRSWIGKRLDVRLPAERILQTLQNLLEN